MALKICSQCNEKVEDDWILCKYCNVPIKDNTKEYTAAADEGSSGSKAKIVIGVVAIIVVILILFAILK